MNKQKDSKNHSSVKTDTQKVSKVNVSGSENTETEKLLSQIKRLEDQARQRDIQLRSRAEKELEKDKTI